MLKLCDMMPRLLSAYIRLDRRGSLLYSSNCSWRRS